MVRLVRWGSLTVGVVAVAAGVAVSWFAAVVAGLGAALVMVGLFLDDGV